MKRLILGLALFTSGCGAVCEECNAGPTLADGEPACVLTCERLACRGFNDRIVSRGGGSQPSTFALYAWGGIEYEGARHEVVTFYFHQPHQGCWEQTGEEVSDWPHCGEHSGNED